MHDWFLWGFIADKQVFVLHILIIHTGKKNQAPGPQALKCCDCKTDYCARNKTRHLQEKIQNSKSIPLHST